MGEKITAVKFANMRGMRGRDVQVLKKMYGNDKKFSSEWEKLLSKKFVIKERKKKESNVVSKEAGVDKGAVEETGSKKKSTTTKKK